MKSYRIDFTEKNYNDIEKKYDENINLKIFMKIFNNKRVWFDIDKLQINNLEEQILNLGGLSGEEEGVI